MELPLGTVEKHDRPELSITLDTGRFFAPSASKVSEEVCETSMLNARADVSKMAQTMHFILYDYSRTAVRWMLQCVTTLVPHLLQGSSSDHGTNTPQTGNMEKSGNPYHV